MLDPQKINAYAVPHKDLPDVYLYIVETLELSLSLIKRCSYVCNFRCLIIIAQYFTDLG